MHSLARARVVLLRWLEHHERTLPENAPSQRLDTSLAPTLGSLLNHRALSTMPRGSLQLLRIASAILLCSFFIYIAFPYRYNVQDTLSYTTRPLWDTSEVPQMKIPHIHAAGVSTNNSDACKRHGWRQNNVSRKVWDATLINTELDLYEIRLQELWDSVDAFLVVESTHTMTGAIKVSQFGLFELDGSLAFKKNLTFHDNAIRFDRWSSKIHYKLIQGREQKQSDGLFTLANEQRSQMSSFM